MEADGLIARVRGGGGGGGDRRSVSVRATAAGRQALVDLEARIQAIDQRIEDGLSPAERRALRGAVDHLARLAVESGAEIGAEAAARGAA